MKLIVGLGNPGPKYETTRHNVGFLAVDFMENFFNTKKLPNKFGGECSETSIESEKILFVKPQQYMNNSGKCVGQFFSFYKAAPKDVIVLYDDIDLNSMNLRIKKGGGTGGHNGIKSIDEHLGSDNNSYFRIRIGIGRSPTIPPDRWVLQPFSDMELAELNDLLSPAKEATLLLIQEKEKEAMNLYNNFGTDKKKGKK